MGSMERVRFMEKEGDIIKIAKFFKHRPHMNQSHLDSRSWEKENGVYYTLEMVIQLLFDLLSGANRSLPKDTTDAMSYMIHRCELYIRLRRMGPEMFDNLLSEIGLIDENVDLRIKLMRKYLEDREVDEEIYLQRIENLIEAEVEPDLERITLRINSLLKVRRGVLNRLSAATFSHLRTAVHNLYNTRNSETPSNIILSIDTFEMMYFVRDEGLVEMDIINLLATDNESLLRNNCPSVRCRVLKFMGKLAFSRLTRFFNSLDRMNALADVMMAQFYHSDQNVQESALEYLMALAWRHTSRGEFHSMRNSFFRFIIERLIASANTSKMGLKLITAYASYDLRREQENRLWAISWEEQDYDMALLLAKVLVREEFDLSVYQNARYGSRYSGFTLSEEQKLTDNQVCVILRNNPVEYTLRTLGFYGFSDFNWNTLPSKLNFIIMLLRDFTEDRLSRRIEQVGRIDSATQERYGIRVSEFSLVLMNFILSSNFELDIWTFRDYADFVGNFDANFKPRVAQQVRAWEENGDEEILNLFEQLVQLNFFALIGQTQQAVRESRILNLARRAIINLIRFSPKLSMRLTCAIMRPFVDESYFTGSTTTPDCHNWQWKICIDKCGWEYFDDMGDEYDISPVKNSLIFKRETIEAIAEQELDDTEEAMDWYIFSQKTGDIEM